MIASADSFTATFTGSVRFSRMISEPFRVNVMTFIEAYKTMYHMVEFMVFSWFLFHTLTIVAFRTLHGSYNMELDDHTCIEPHIAIFS